MAIQHRLMCTIAVSDCVLYADEVVSTRCDGGVVVLYNDLLVIDC